MFCKKVTRQSHEQGHACARKKRQLLCRTTRLCSKSMSVDLKSREIE